MQSDTALADILQLREPQKKALAHLGVGNVRDLLYHFPSRYESTVPPRVVSSLAPGVESVLYGRISGLATRKAFKRHIPMAEGHFTDETGTVKVIWLHQAYLAKMVGENSLVRLQGKASERNGSLAFINPRVERIEKLPQTGERLFGDGESSHSLYPVYPETRGLSSNWLYHAVQKVIRAGALEKLEDPMPSALLEKYHLPGIKTALIWMHAPKSENDAAAARKRFAFEEVFTIQLSKQRDRRLYESEPAFSIGTKPEEVAAFIARFPFKPTAAQSRAIEAIFTDTGRGHPMARLLEGDVGSGKTFVAAVAAYATVTARPKGQDFGNLGVAYMAPTEVLARQQFESFIQFFAHTGVQIGLITGSGCEKFPSKVDPRKATDISRAQLLKWVAEGTVPIVVGTHALIQKSVMFKHLALVVIDEQHRFGVNQRMALVRGKNAERTPTDAEHKPANPLLYKDLTYRIRTALFTVRKTLGLGHKEVVYQRAVEEEFKKVGLSFTREKKIPIFYNKKNVGIYQPDFVVEEKVIVELKSLPFLGTTEKKQLWTYLKGSEYRLALLVNFGTAELTIERVVYDTARVSASSLRRSASVPHLLSMTATPIPRTLALTIYGDLDLTLLDEMPAGRKTVITELIALDRAHVYERMRAELTAGRQAYVICPRIDEPDPAKEMALQAKSVKEESARLKRDVFPDREIGVLHSKMKPDEKERVMTSFKKGLIDILVSTSVVEVGVNVPNATVIVIEGAERFGLAQLHQLRGRVVRSTHQAYCFAISETKTKTSIDRLKALVTAKNGFELAELDLKARGAGTLSGREQWGVSDVAMEALRNLKMVEAARAEARALIESDPELGAHPLLKAKLAASDEIHFE